MIICCLRIFFWVTLILASCSCCSLAESLDYPRTMNFVRYCCGYVLMFPTCLSLLKHFCLWQNCWKKAQHCHIFVEYRQMFFQSALEVGSSGREVGWTVPSCKKTSLSARDPKQFLLEKENHCATARQLIGYSFPVVLYQTCVWLSNSLEFILVLRKYK